MTGLRLTTEDGFKVDWPGLGEKLTASVSKGFGAFASGDGTAAFDGAAALLGAARSLNREVPLGTRALELIVLAFAWAFDSQRAEGHLKEDDAKEAARQAIDTLRRRVEGGDEEILIPHDFFDQPAAAEPYRMLRNDFIAARAAYRPDGDGDAEGLKYRFDSAFRSAVFRLWADRLDAFQELETGLQSPAAKAADVDRQWRAYRESLIHDFHVAPVFGQEQTRVSLAQLYVPLRCFWREGEPPGEEPVRYGRGETPEREILHLRDLDTELKAWIDNDDPEDWLRLLGGGPGSGKSTSMKALAARLAERDDLRPLFVPLHRLRVNGDLRRALNTYFREEGGLPFRVDVLDKEEVAQGPRLVLIFDGLDEMVRPGERAKEVARDMVDWIVDLYRALKGTTGREHRVIVSGREAVFQEARRRAGHKGAESLEVVGYLPPAETLEDNVIELEGDEALLTKDQRPDWWQAYAAAIGRPMDQPRGLSEKRLEPLTAEPLLCYLLALAGALENGGDDVVVNRNRLYAGLLDDVWSRGWGPGRVGPGVALEKADFNALMEALALAAWHGGDERVATEDRFDTALKVMRAEETYDAFLRDGGAEVGNLAVVFYLRQADRRGRGIEFTHRSFGEYLAARALLSAGRDLADSVRRGRLDHALTDWLEVVQDGDLTHELLAFLRDEARLWPVEDAAALLRSLETLMGEVAKHGFPAHRLTGCATWRQAEERQRKAEMMLLALINSASDSLAGRDDDAARVRIDWDGDESVFRRLLRRVAGESGPARALFARFDLRGARLEHQDLGKLNLLGADLTGAVLSGANLMGADLSTAILKDAILSTADLSTANLNGAGLMVADVAWADLTMAMLVGADFEGADLRKAKFKHTAVNGANFARAFLEDADLTGADGLAAAQGLDTVIGYKPSED